MNILKKYTLKFIFILIFVSISCSICFNYFYSIFISDTIIIKYAIHPFNIYEEQPIIWNIIKKAFIINYLFSNIIIFNSIFSTLIKFKQKIFNYISKYSRTNTLSNKNIDKSKLENKNQNFIINKKTKDNIPLVDNTLSLIIGKDSSNNLVKISEKSLYQNILVTGTIGSGKTSGAMYPFTKQLIKYCSHNVDKKLGMLILDVKGNYHLKVSEFMSSCNRSNDLIVFDLSGKIKYNPLFKPNLKASVLANRLKTILLLFSPNNSESFWLDKVEEILTECIKLCRLYNNNYVTFEELHNIVVFPNYYREKISILKQLFVENKFSKEDCYNLLSAINFFEKEYRLLDDRTLSILKSEITRITNLFVSDYSIKNIFCPLKEEINFSGFKDIINNGRVVVLNINISEYQNLSKVIAAYLKLDFQTEVMSRISNLNSYDLNNIRPVCFICDEYHEYVTSSDANFFSQSREAKCISIISTQSYTSLLNTLNNQSNVKVIIQNLVNKIWLRSDDIFTIEDAQKQIGKEEKNKISKTISENAKDTNFNYLFNKFNSKDSSISESINSYYQLDYIYDINSFSRDLELFKCICFLSDGYKIIDPQKITLLPYFKQ